MDFSWSPEQLAVQQKVIQFATENLNDGIVDADHQGTFSMKKWKACAEFGIQGLMVPAEFGGQEVDILTAVLAMEGLGYACRDNGLSFALNSVMWALQPTLVQFATTEQKEKYLTPMVLAQKIGAYGMSEPDSGSDAFSLKTTAEKTDGGYLLNGHKMLITFAPIADFALIFASTRPDAGRWGISAFLVDSHTSGFERTPVEDKMGLRTVPIGQIKLTNCFVPASQLLGKEGAGASIFSAGQEWERGCILASQVGAMQRQVETAVAYARERKQFGQSIGKFQAVSHRISDMKLRLEIARLLLYQAAWHKQVGKPSMLNSALAKLYLGDAAIQSSLDTITVHGGRGYLTNYEVERDLRDTVGGPLYGGTADIQRNIIARLLGL